MTVATPSRLGEPGSGEAPSRWVRSGFLQGRIAGTPEQLGAQHGELFREEIRDILVALKHHVLYGQKGFDGLALRTGVRTTARLMERRIPQRYRREMSALARAAGVPYSDVLLINCIDDVFANLYQLGELFGRLGCSAFAISDAQADGGRLICGRNLDYFIQSAVGEDVWAATSYMREHVVAIEYRPSTGRSFVSVGWPGFIGVATGMNQAGLALGSLTVSARRNWPFATPATLTYRMVLEQAESLQGAVDLIRRSSRTQGNNVLVGSGGEGRAVVVEYTPWEFAIREPDRGRICTTNHFVAPRLERRNRSGVPGSSAERMARLGELCVSASAEVESAGEFLVDTALRNPEANEYCAVQNPCTIYGVVFAPDESCLWLRVADRSDRPFERVRLG
ncbi:MAG: hypothetical protein HY534_00450 [Chloroflexi bacterium]|nr:hypothetical protein [Chloroflexota bacterium]